MASVEWTSKVEVWVACEILDGHRVFLDVCETAAEAASVCENESPSDTDEIEWGFCRDGLDGRVAYANGTRFRYFYLALKHVNF